MKSRHRTTWALTLAAALSGCASFSDSLAVHQRLADDRGDARRSWMLERPLYVNEPYIGEFRHGYIEGYCDVLLGEPLHSQGPRRFWNTSHTGMQGNDRLCAWQRGYETGAARAMGCAVNAGNCCVDGCVTDACVPNTCDANCAPIAAPATGGNANPVQPPADPGTGNAGAGSGGQGQNNQGQSVNPNNDLPGGERPRIEPRPRIEQPPVNPPGAVIPPPYNERYMPPPVDPPVRNPGPAAMNGPLIFPEAVSSLNAPAPQPQPLSAPGNFQLQPVNVEAGPAGDALIEVRPAIKPKGGGVTSNHSQLSDIPPLSVLAAQVGIDAQSGEAFLPPIKMADAPAPLPMLSITPQQAGHYQLLPSIPALPQTGQPGVMALTPQPAGTLTLLPVEAPGQFSLSGPPESAAQLALPPSGGAGAGQLALPPVQPASGEFQLP